MAEPNNLTDPIAAQGGVRALLQLGQAQLAPNSDSARLDAELLLAHCLGVTRGYLFAHADELVQPANRACYVALLQRRADGEPLAYLTGWREFWSLELQVSAAVLVPRPETELAVECALALLADVPADVADLGTGSGAIALALASERRAWRIVATDHSADALAVARRNAERLNLRGIAWLQGDWLAPLGSRRFDLIVSNPPYIAQADPALPALRHEPAAALVSGASGLNALQHLITQAHAYLHRGGVLLLEHGATQAAAVAGQLVAAGYARVRCHQDLAGRDRVTEAQWP